MQEKAEIQSAEIHDLLPLSFPPVVVSLPGFLIKIS